MSEHLPCKPRIPDVSPYLSNRQVIDWVQGSNSGVKTSHISDRFPFRIQARLLPFKRWVFGFYPQSNDFSRKWPQSEHSHST
ncbi:hypothetical protein DPMN_082774 [Dreissena polymorpha]|uniref:Uncharacterized protein n=1 Tax=Dreissena polymorpha TaxID=45954 RepID=A0A9D4BHM1_DREPO|nr:hypothetical protein DPMN_082774 [Dreissena polymorpha]